MNLLKPVGGFALAIGVAFLTLVYAQTGTIEPDRAFAPDKAHPGASVSEKNASRNLARSDRKFMEKMAEHNVGQIALGKLAQKNGLSEDVKRFAQEIVEDHAKSNEALKKIADAKGVSLPTETDRSHLRAFDRLQSKTGGDFDGDYVNAMIRNYRSGLKDLEKKARDAKDGDVKNFAENNEAGFQKLLNIAQQMQNSMKASLLGKQLSHAASGSVQSRTASDSSNE